MKLNPMETAPTDRTVILVKFKDDLGAYDIDGPNGHWARRWGGRWAAVQHEGVSESGYDFGWSIALPVGHGGFAAEWFEGWLPLPEVER